MGQSVYQRHEWMDLETRIWRPPQILQEWMTSSLTWQRGVSLVTSILHSLIFDCYLLYLDYFPVNIIYILAPPATTPAIWRPSISDASVQP